MAGRMDAPCLYDSQKDGPLHPSPPSPSPLPSGCGATPGPAPPPFTSFPLPLPQAVGPHLARPLPAQRPRGALVRPHGRACRAGQHVLRPGRAEASQRRVEVRVSLSLPGGGGGLPCCLLWSSAQWQIEGREGPWLPGGGGLPGCLLWSSVVPFPCHPRPHYLPCCSRYVPPCPSA